MAKRVKMQSRKVPATSSAEAESTFRSSESAFNPDYSQTIKDLRRIAMLAGLFFTVLIALSFIL